MIIARRRSRLCKLDGFATRSESRRAAIAAHSRQSCVFVADRQAQAAIKIIKTGSAHNRQVEAGLRQSRIAHQPIKRGMQPLPAASTQQGPANAPTKVRRAVPQPCKRACQYLWRGNLKVDVLSQRFHHEVRAPGAARAIVTVRLGPDATHAGEQQPHRGRKPPAFDFATWLLHR
jgi:hypothetical protein